jgi:hypothetical protein
VITNDDTVNFTQGNCHELALAINAITGWPIYTFYDPDEDLADLHAFVQCPRGTFVDVQGEKCRQSMYDAWTGWYPDYEIRELMNHDEFTEQGWGLYSSAHEARETRRRAKLVAEHIAKSYNEGKLWGDDADRG